MGKRRSLNEILEATKTGHYYSMEGVGNIVKRFVHTPLAALFDPEEWLSSIGDLIGKPDDREAIGEWARKDYASFVDAFGGRMHGQGVARSNMVFELGIRGFTEPGANRRCSGRMPVDDRKEDQNSGWSREKVGTGNHPSWPEVVEDGLFTKKECMKYGELSHKVVLPFLRIPVSDYIIYTDMMLGDEYGVSFDYDYWFREDVDLWEMEQGTPTIADVLCRSTEAFVCLADIQDKITLLQESELHDKDRFGNLDRPFQRRNLSDSYWPPEDGEGLLAAKRIWLLMIEYPYELYRLYEGKKR